MNPVGGVVFKQDLVNGMSLSHPGACDVPLGAICGDGSQQSGLLELFSWEKTAASASCLATFNLA